MNPRPMLATVVALVGLAGCANGTESRAAGGPDQTTSTATAAAVPLAQHVVTDLAGFTAKASPVVQDVEAFARAHEKDAAELTRAGMVGGVTVQFQPDGKIPGNALSLAQEFGTAEQAEVEAARLFAANAEPDKGSTASPLPVPGIPGARATSVTGSFKGQSFTSVEIVFVDETVVHELFAIAGDPVVSVPELVRAATGLYAVIHGHPLA